MRESSNEKYIALVLVLWIRTDLTMWFDNVVAATSFIGPMTE